MKDLFINRIDTYNSNQDAIEIRKILNLKNQYLKIFTLNCMLHYTSYGTTAETQITEALINLTTGHNTRSN